MTESDQMNDIRSRILQDPEALLNDREVMRALVTASDADQAANVIDLKTVVLKRLESRLEDMEGQNNTIVSAAYENMSTTSHVHRAILNVLEPKTFPEFLDFLRTTWAHSLNIDVARVCLEAPAIPLKDMPALQSEFGPGVVFLQKDEIDYYITLGKDIEARPISLRQIRKGVSKIHGILADEVRSEALMKLDLGTGNRPGLLLLGSKNPDQFAPNMGTDLLMFYGSVFEKVMQRWLYHD